jgi:hypothetical protein
LRISRIQLSDHLLPAAFAAIWVDGCFAVRSVVEAANRSGSQPPKRQGRLERKEPEVEGHGWLARRKCWTSAGGTGFKGLAIESSPSVATFSGIMKLWQESE